MIVVAGVGGEVDFSKEFLLVILEFADHLALLFYFFLDLRSYFAGMKSNNFGRHRIGQSIYRR